MKCIYRYLLLAAIVSAFAAPKMEAAKLNLPPWLAEASKRATLQEKDTVAEVLHDESVVTVAANGRMTKYVARAVRAVTDDGREATDVAVFYDSSTEKVAGFRAWVIRPDGDGKSYVMKDGYDIACAMEAVYAESRKFVFSASKDIYKGCVFGYEYTVEDRGVFGENQWIFHSIYPVALSRITYKLPKDWTIKGSMLNHADLQPTVKDNIYTWEMRDLPAVKTEPLSPPGVRIYPILLINVYPPANMRNPPLLIFDSWSELSSYGCKIFEKPCQVDAAIKTKTQELLATAGTGLWQRLNVLARFAQSTNYVSISMNTGSGGGLIPRNASDVLKTGYGDCKDKTALLCAMFKSAGIQSYPVYAYSGNRYQVMESWPTPIQFNHAIIAIKVEDPSISSPVMVDHPQLGRLLFFDPTDPYTPLGDLLYDEQGSLVLLLAEGNTALLRLPFTSPTANHLDRRITAEITVQGHIGAEVVEKSTGQTASHERALYKSPNINYANLTRDWINTSVKAASVKSTKVMDDQEKGLFTMTTEFTAPNYGQSMRGKLLVFKPAIVSRRDFVPLTEPKREYPVILTPRSYSETSDIFIPADYKVDELPQSVEKVTSFGSYSAKCTYDETKHQINYQRSLTINAAEIPAKDYAMVRQFYETIRKAEQSPVVLVLKE